MRGAGQYGGVTTRVLSLRGSVLRKANFGLAYSYRQVTLSPSLPQSRPTPSLGI